MTLTRSTAETPVRPPGYAAFLEQFAARIRHAQLRAVSAVNAETILLYYESGRAIRAEQVAKGWGARVIQQLSLQAELAAVFEEFPAQTTSPTKRTRPQRR